MYQVAGALEFNHQKFIFDNNRLIQIQMTELLTFSQPIFIISDEMIVKLSISMKMLRLSTLICAVASKHKSKQKSTENL